jgi:hypothetical protein
MTAAATPAQTDLGRGASPEPGSAVPKPLRLD